MKLGTIRKRILESALQFARNEKALRDERRIEREHPCLCKSRPEWEVGHPGDSSCLFCTPDEINSREGYCDNCAIVMALCENRTGNRRLRQLAKERLVRLTKLIETRDEESLVSGRGVWRAIETAPTDGTFILTATDSGHISIRQWCVDKYWRSHLEGEPVKMVLHPSFWMPLPDAPRAA